MGLTGGADPRRPLSSVYEDLRCRQAQGWVCRLAVRSDATVSELLALLSEHRIGAVVVSDDGEAVHGIVSERDVVRHLHSAGRDILDGPVAVIMTKEVRTCGLEDSLEHLEDR